MLSLLCTQLMNWATVFQTGPANVNIDGAKTHMNETLMGSDGGK